jgi:threonine/homoserine/homoserine lactone efflux protein
VKADIPFISFILQAVLISLSGVMAPGPITAATIGSGNRSPHAGAFIALGHGIVEFPLMVLVFYGFGRWFNMPMIKISIGMIGGIFLLIMARGMIISAGRIEKTEENSSRSPLVSGIILSAGNPYFLIWWATVGAVLVLNSSNYGITGVIIFMIAHWLCDFIWFYILSIASFKGGDIFGRKFQKIIFGFCGIFLFIFGIKYIVDAFTLITA